MLTEIEFRNIGVLANLKVNLGRMTVLVGPTGCGKSATLNNIDLLCRMTEVKDGEGFALGSPGRALESLEVDALRTAGAEGAMAWSGLTDQGVRLGLEITTGAGPWYARGAAVISGVVSKGNPLLIPSTPENFAAFQQALSTNLGLRAQRLRLVPDQIAAPASVRTRTLDPSGGGLPTILKDLAGEDQEAYSRIKSDLKAVVPAFEELKYPKLDINGQPYNGLELVLHGAGRVPASRVSDGTLIALALLTATHNRDLPPLILMDDIDHGLHLSAQYELVKAIRAVMAVRPELQVVCTTHSPVLLDSFEVSEVRVMALGKDGHVRVRPLEEHPKLDKWREGYSAGELWANLGEEWVANG